MTDKRRFVLFVYGTLLSGETSHALLEGAESLGAATTLPEFDLFDLGPYPAAVHGGATALTGELYVIDAQTLAKLDVHEDAPRLFKRVRVALADGREADTYVLDRDQVRGRRKIRSGDWRARFTREASPTSARDAPMLRWMRNRER